MQRTDLVEAEITRGVIGAFYEVYNTLDFGFLEHVYKAALDKEMRARGLRVDREVRIVVRYKGEPIAVQIVDMVVNDKVIVEVKSTQELHAGALRQLQNYLRATHVEVGLLLDFGLEARFHRLVDLHAPASD